MVIKICLEIRLDSQLGQMLSKLALVVSSKGKVRRRLLSHSLFALFVRANLGGEYFNWMSRN